MDAIEFAKTGIDELNARLSQIGNIPDASSANFAMTPEEVVAKFFSDQGLTFENMDIKKVLSLTSTPVVNPTPPVAPIEEPDSEVEE